MTSTLPDFGEFMQAAIVQGDGSNVEVPDGFLVGMISNIGTPEGHVRVTFLPEAAFKKPGDADTTEYKRELEPGDRSCGHMVVHPDTGLVLTWGDTPR